MITFCRLTIAALLALSSLIALPVHAQPTPLQKDIARDALILGRKRFEAGQYVEARGLFLEAHNIMHVPTTALDLMKAYGALDQLVEAWAIGEEIQKQPVKLTDPPAYTDARKQINEAMEALATRIPTIQLKISDTALSELRVKIDGHTVWPWQIEEPIRVNPGDRKIDISARNCDPLSKTVTTEAGVDRHYDVEVKLICNRPSMSSEAPTLTPVPKTPVPETPIEPARAFSLPWLLVGTGLLAVGAGTGIGAGVNYLHVRDAAFGINCGQLCRQVYEERRPLLEGLSWTAVIAGSLGAASMITAFVQPVLARKPSNTQQGHVMFFLQPGILGATMRTSW